MNHEPRKWPLQEAKAKFSELVRRAQTEGPQTVTVHGQPAVVISKVPESAGDISKMTGKDLWAALRTGPLFDFDIPDWETEGEFRDVEL
jgi:prevent-host-death family protein